MNPLIIICMLKSIYRSLVAGALVSGHDYRTVPSVKQKTPPNVHLTECAICGKRNISWSWESLEEYK